MSNAMHGPDTPTEPPVTGTLLSPVLRRRLAELNRGYLELSVDRAPATDVRLLPPAQAGRIARMDDMGRQRLADAPLALFELRVTEALAEPVARGAGVADTSGSRPVDPGGTADEPLLQFAVFFAWHVATTAPLSALLMLGLHGPALRLLLEVPPARLGLLARSSALLRPRWPDNAALWDALLEGAASGSEVLLRRAHCLGVQLLSEQVATATPAAAAATASRTRAR